MKRKHNFREWLSLRVARAPGSVILGTILIFNVILFFISAVVISALAPESLKNNGFWYSVFYTVTMILDAGCISYVIEDVGAASVALMITCLLVVFIGSITFTGAVIGYITNIISDFVESANSGESKLHITGHTVILNWNSRASEIVNDLLYSEKKEKVVVLVPEGKESVQREIRDRIQDTLERERRYVLKQAEGKAGRERNRFLRENWLHNRVTVIVREGDTFSTQKLNDVCIDSAKAVIILGRERISGACCFASEELERKTEKGNAATVKTLIQVAELTGADTSADNQQIIVETEDDWTLNLVEQIIEHKQRQGKCNIVPVPVNEVLGQILSQFTIMPELNYAYSELFSNKGAAFYSATLKGEEGEDLIASLMDRNGRFIPAAGAQTECGTELYYVAAHESDVFAFELNPVPEQKLKVNQNFNFSRRNIVILGHNSKIEDILKGFNAFRGEWNFTDPTSIEKYGTNEILNIVIIDNEKSLERHGAYRAYPYVEKVITADVFDREKICDAINRCVDENEGDTSVLILSDDRADREEQDAAALTYLIYVQGIISERIKQDPGFDVESIDVVVELLNPKNYDIVRAYSVDNIIISNRYVSKMITQISEKQELYSFYRDILTYDEEGADSYSSNELYAKPVRDFFTELPAPCSALSLCRSVYHSTPKDNRAVLLGIAYKGGKTEIFSGDLNAQQITLHPEDKLLVFSNH